MKQADLHGHFGMGHGMVHATRFGNGQTEIKCHFHP